MRCDWTLAFLLALCCSASAQKPNWVAELHHEGYDSPKYVAVLPGSALHTGIEFSAQGDVLCWFPLHNQLGFVKRDELRQTDPLKLRVLKFAQDSGRVLSRLDLPTRAQWESGVFGFDRGIVISRGNHLSLYDEQFERELQEVQIEPRDNSMLSISRLAGGNVLRITTSGANQERFVRFFDTETFEATGRPLGQPGLIPIVRSMTTAAYLNRQTGEIGFVNSSGAMLPPVLRIDMRCGTNLQFVSRDTLVATSCAGFSLFSPNSTPQNYRWPEVFNVLSARLAVSANGARIAFLSVNQAVKGKGDPASAYSLHTFDRQSSRFLSTIRLPAAKSVLEIALSKSGDRVAIEEDGTVSLFPAE